MPGIHRLATAVSVGLCLALLSSAPAGAQVRPYRSNDPGGFRNILPPGSNGLANLGQLIDFIGACPLSRTTNCPSAPRPPHSSDQLGMYANLVNASPRLRSAALGDYFKDASFGVRRGQAERTYSPRSGVTIVRDRAFGVPHIYATTRAGAMFAAGYVGAEDRLFVMDVLRHAGRAELSSFAGGDPSNLQMDRDQWANAPYTEADLQRQYDLGDDVYGAEGRQLQRDGANYVAGVNAYIADARANGARMPGEYVGIGRSAGPEPWKVTDLIATASLIGSIFGKGGGSELESGLLYQDAVRRFGPRAGRRVWADLRRAEDPEAPVTVHGKRFPYELPPRRTNPGSIALPDRGSVTKVGVAPAGAARLASRSGARGAAGGLLAFPDRSSNALLVSARESRTGRPLAVMGPQVSYFAPQLLTEMDIHAPGIDARGVAFPGVNLYVQLGRGRNFAWSATSAGQDIIDTFAVDLCDPSGRRPTKASTSYRFHGRCLPMEVLERRNSWKPNIVDPTPAGSERLRAERTKLGIVIARATIGGRPVAYVRLRSTYGHEADSGRGFSDLMNPAKVRTPRDFVRATSKINFTFNWFYADSRHIAYFNSGNNPVRAKGVNPSFPTRAGFEWRGWNPNLYTARYTPASSHPQVVDQRYLTSWNNKQARGFRAADDNFGFGSVYRSEPLDDRILRGIRGRRKLTLSQLVDAMEGAATVDLRADEVLPFALRVLGHPRDLGLRAAVATLRAWKRAGAHRIDRNGDLRYEHTGAIRILDAWWPRWLKAEFEPTLGSSAFDRLEGILGLDNPPNNGGAHLGSAYQGGWYGYAQKDLRALLGGRVRGRFSRIYCGGTRRHGGTLRRCRRALAASLRSALRVDPKALYRDQICAGYGRPSDQWCYDAIRFRPIGAILQPLIPWVNRPTFQQAVEVQARR